MNNGGIQESSPATKWWLLGFASLAMFGNYYVYDAIAPLADQLNRELGYTDTQIGSLNAIYSIPNIFLVLIGGLLVDKFGAGRVAFYTAVLWFAGTVVSASSGDYATMVTGRLLFGLGSETFLVAITVAIGLRFTRHAVGLAMALNLSFGRLGSYAADVSPIWAGGLYDQGWQAPMILAAVISTTGILGSAVCWWIEKNRPEVSAPTTEPVHGTEKFHWRDVFSFDRSYWYIAALSVLFYSVIFPFRSTFAIKYFQHAHDKTLEAASLINSYVFLTAIFLTPLFGYIADRFGRRGLFMVFGSLLLPLSFVGLLSEDWGAWWTTGMLGISFSLIPAILWPSVVKIVEKDQLGTAYGLMFMTQNMGMAASNLIAGAMNDAFDASAKNPAGYAPMLIYFAIVAACAFFFAIALWRRESGPHGHGLEIPR